MWALILSPGSIRTELNCKTLAAVRELLDMWKTYISGVKSIKYVSERGTQRCAVVVVVVTYIKVTQSVEV